MIDLILKILFLDIDGVLNSQNYITRTMDEREKMRIDEMGNDSYWAMLIDPDAVAVLNTIIKATGAKVVLSSSWRNSHSLTEMRAFLKLRGFEGELIDKTPKRAPMAPYLRGNEIQAWLDKHPEVKQFVILDDDSDMAHLSGKLVQMHWGEGLLPKHCEAIIKHLEGK